jgi:hypothetical protein
MHVMSLRERRTGARRRRGRRLAAAAGAPSSPVAAVVLESDGDTGTSTSRRPREMASQRLRCFVRLVCFVFEKGCCCRLSARDERANERAASASRRVVF